MDPDWTVVNRKKPNSKLVADLNLSYLHKIDPFDDTRDAAVSDSVTKICIDFGNNFIFNCHQFEACKYVEHCKSNRIEQITNTSMLPTSSSFKFPTHRHMCHLDHRHQCHRYPSTNSFQSFLICKKILHRFTAISVVVVGIDFIEQSKVIGTVVVVFLLKLCFITHLLISFTLIIKNNNNNHNNRLLSAITIITFATIVQQLLFSNCASTIVNNHLEITNESPLTVFYSRDNFLYCVFTNNLLLLLSLPSSSIQPSTAVLLNCYNCFYTYKLLILCLFCLCLCCCYFNSTKSTLTSISSSSSSCSIVNKNVFKNRINSLLEYLNQKMQNTCILIWKCNFISNPSNRSNENDPTTIVNSSTAEHAKGGERRKGAERGLVYNAVHSFVSLSSFLLYCCWSSKFTSTNNYRHYHHPRHPRHPRHRSKAQFSSTQMSDISAATNTSAIASAYTTTSAFSLSSHFSFVSSFFVPLLLILTIVNQQFMIANGQHAKQVATIPGQLVIGALFSIREQPTLRAAQTRTCGEVREQYGIHRVEAAFQTIETINKDPNILPNITLGIEIRDSCWYSAIALEQSIEFIRDAMAASEEKAFASSPKNPFFGPGSVYDSYDDHDQSGDQNDPGRILGLFQPRFGNVHTPCPKVTKKAKNIVGVIGPASSTNSIQVQNLLQLFNIPQIGYSSTSRELSGKNFFKFFLRVVPSDHHQAQVVSSLFQKFNWTYISVVYTDGSYGSGLMEIFKNNAQDVGICIAYMESIPANGDDKTYDAVVHNLLAFRNAKVVACFCEGSSVRLLLQAKKRLNITTEFLLVGSDGWSDRPDVVKGLEKEAQGSLTVRIYSPFVKEFDERYFELNPLNNHRNPWFPEFWEMKMNCSLQNLTGLVIVHPNNVTFTRQCTGQEKLIDFVHKKKPRYKQDNKMSFVVKAIWTMAHGLHNMQKDICQNVTGLCNEMLPINGSILLNHLNKVKFKWNREVVEFDDNGDPPGRYDIMNFQELKKGEYDYVQVGEWNSGGHFNINKPIQWPRTSETRIRSNYTDIRVLNKQLTIPESVCSKPCPKGQAKNIQSDSVKCCWICVPCRENEYLTKEEKCKACTIGTWPNENLTNCTAIPIEFIHWFDTASLIAVCISLLGFGMTIFTMVVFIKHNNTPVVKASTRELSYAIFVGMFLCHGTTFALIAKPTKFACYVTRILPGLSFAIMYSALVTKTNRIARILAGSKKRIITKKPRFMSSTAQVVITWLLISVEVGIIVTVLIREPADKMLKYPSLDRVVLTCNTKVLGISAPLGFDFVLIGFCTLYAIKTRNVPENFNEAKFIGFAMYTTLVIWIAFVPIYYNSDENVITLSLCISFSAIVALILLFFPKLYIILFKPEKNNRSFFTTAKNVRCHIGYMTAAATSSSMAVSRHSSHSTSEFSMESPRNHSIDVHYKKPDISTIHNPYPYPGSNYPPGSGHNLNNIKRIKPKLDTKKKSLGFFSRLRISKQDKIAANVAEHIRAVRAAEALDRQTGRGRRFNTSQSFSEKQIDNEMESSVQKVDTQPSQTLREDSVGLLARQDTASRRVRIIHILRKTFGEDFIKLPQFSAIVNCLKNECSHTFCEISTQTSFDNGLSSLALNGGQCRGGIGSELYRNSLSNSLLRHRGTHESRSHTDDWNDGCSSRSTGKIDSQMEPDLHRNIGKTLSSDESILSVTGSVVVEENASSGGEDSSQDSGVYKNIIINLGNLIAPDSATGSMSQLPTNRFLVQSGAVSDLDLAGQPLPPPPPPLGHNVSVIGGGQLYGHNEPEISSFNNNIVRSGPIHNNNNSNLNSNSNGNNTGMRNVSHELVGILKKTK